MIGVNQDPLGIQGNRTKQDGTSEVWQVPLKNGTRVALAVNRGDSATDITIQWTDIGFPSSAVSRIHINVVIFIFIHSLLMCLIYGMVVR